ncbi:T9SS type A sorting domain-containing protein [Owenweeksia hongkongensis]|uniref:T9SS type A sorting domain-containing protein n=1 Tax=Owenweeksia hongkongensis TaxID=253245 RepID=UPI003A91945F
MLHSFLTWCFILSLLTPTTIISQPKRTWLQTVSNSGSSTIHTIDTDTSGNIYVSGIFSGTCDFDPGPSTHFETIANKGFFIYKLDSNHILQWVTVTEGLGRARFGQMSVSDNGEVALTGGFFGTNNDFDPKGNGLYLHCSGGLSAFIAKWDSSGSFRWAYAFDAGGDQYGTAVDFDAFGNLIVTGRYVFSIDFDPGPDSVILHASPFGSCFVLKFTIQGNLTWAKEIRGSGAEASSALMVASNGDILIGGEYSESADFDPNSTTYFLTTGSVQNLKGFVVRWTADGNFIWVKPSGGLVYSLDEDLNNNIVASGTFWGTSDFSPTPTKHELTSLGGVGNGFTHKLRPNGDMVWVRNTCPATGFGTTSKIITDDASNIYTTGSYAGTAYFGPANSRQIIPTRGQDDTYISKLDSNGVFKWVKTIGYSGSAYGGAILNTNPGEVYFSVNFDSSIDVDITASDSIITSAGGKDFVILRLEENLSSIGQIESNQIGQEVSIFPNPTNGSLTLSIQHKSELLIINIYNYLGKKLSEQSFFNKRQFGLNILGAPGLYYIEIISDNSRVVVPVTKK